MFWRYGYQNSTFTPLLEKEDLTLEELLEEEDLIQETKSLNPKLIDFLSKPSIIKSLLHYITATDLNEEQRYKYPFLASEIIACEVQQILEAIIMENRDLLIEFWSFLDRPAQPTRRVSDINHDKVEGGLDSLQASYFCKTIGVLLNKYPSEMLNFIKSRPDSLNRILSHLQTSAIMDLMISMIRMEELIEGKGIVKWLSKNGLLENLINRLDPYLDNEEHSIAQHCICEIIRMSQTSIPETHSIGVNELIIDLKSESTMKKLVKYMLDPKAPNGTSTLINGVMIIIELIRQNNSDLENDPTIAGVYGYQTNHLRTDTVSLADMLRVMADHIDQFTQLLLKPRSVKGPIRTTMGQMEPLGFERLKICELFAELLHCSNMSNLNNHNLMIQELSDLDDIPRVSDKTDPKKNQSSGTAKMTKIEPELAVGDYLKLKFVSSKSIPVCIDLFFAFPWNNFLHYVVYDMLHQIFNGRMDTGYNRNLALSALHEGRLTDKIVLAQKTNDRVCAEPKGMRAGYMGHLTFISDEIMKLFEGYPETIVATIRDSVDLNAWNNYCHNELRETKEKELLPLGGLRPNDDLDVPHSDDDEDVLEGVAANQYSRYLSQRGGEVSYEDEDDDNDHWIAGRDDFNGDYEYTGGEFMSVDKNTIMSHQNEVDDYDDNDAEGHDMNDITPDWTRNFSKFPPNTTLRRIPSHSINSTDDYEDSEEYDHLADAEELERRASLRKQTFKQMNEDRMNDEEEDVFGDFESAGKHQWSILNNNMESLTIKKPTTSTSSISGTTPNEQHFVRAIKTKEEEGLKQKKDYQLNEGEQEGEI